MYTLLQILRSRLQSVQQQPTTPTAPLLEKYDYYNVITPTDIGIETVIVDVGNFKDNYIIEGYIDLGNMTYGDTVEVREYIAIDGANYKLFTTFEVLGPVSEPVIRFHSKTLYKSSRYKVTIVQKSGTLKSIPYFFTVQVFSQS